MLDRLQLPGWRRRLEGEKAAKRYEAEAATTPRVAVPGVLPAVGHTATFIRRMTEAVSNRFAWLLDAYDDYPPRRGGGRTLPPISGAQNVPTTLAHPPGTVGAASSFAVLRRRGRM